LRSKTDYFNLLTVLLAFVSILAFLIFPPLAWPVTEIKVAALAVFCIVLWATNVISPLLTSLLFFLLAMLFSVAPPEVIFSGFSSPAEWLTFGGLVIGLGISCTGLGKRVANIFINHLGTSYQKLIISLVMAGISFGFIMPSATGRVVLLVPIAIEISNYFGFKKGENGRIGIVLAIILGSYIPSFAILPANVPNMILAGMSELLFDITFSYSEYFLLHFPVLGVMKGVVIIGLILWFYTDRIDKNKTKNTTSAAPFSKDETVLSVVLVVLFILWITDYMHHVSPAWVALGGAVVLLLPRIGVISPQSFNKEINIGLLIFVAGILGFGSMISHSGLGDQLANSLLPFLPLEEGNPFQSYISLNFISMLTGAITTLPGVPAVLTPLADNFTNASGLPLKATLMAQVSGFSIVLFPYQAPPILIGMLLSGEKGASALKILMLLALITIFLLLPLNYLWWDMIGWI
jgi:di/tricarboxylate transporter